MKYKKSLKSQAALEFLTTYGWAFLVILIMIGTLAYFGILSPGKILPNRCNFGAEFQCVDHQLRATTTAGTFEVRVKLKNSIGEPLEVTTATLSKDDGTAFATCALAGTLTAWKSGESRDLTWTGCTGTGLVTGDKGKALVTIRYYTSTSSATYAKEVKGDIFSTVLPSS